MAQDQKKLRFSSIDFLRGLMALLVVIHHAVTNGNYSAIDSEWFEGVVYFFGQFFQRVPIFFVISGYVIHASWAKAKKSNLQDSFDFKKFWRRRFNRIYPTYFVVLLMSFSLILLAYLLGKNVALVRNYPDPTLSWMGLDFLAHSFLLHGFHPTFDRAGGNPPLWTLSRQEYLYLLYPLLLLIRQRVSMSSILIGTAVMSVVASFFGNLHLQAGTPAYVTFQTSILCIWVQWCLGAYLAEVHHGLAKFPNLIQNPIFVPISFGLAKLAEWYAHDFRQLTWGLFFFLLLNTCTRLELEGKWKDSRLTVELKNIGVYSYSLYLIHYPVQMVVKQLLGTIAYTLNPWVYILNVLIMTIASMIAAKILFYFVESRTFKAQIQWISSPIRRLKSLRT